jgi:hypothetical protein
VTSFLAAQQLAQMERQSEGRVEQAAAVAADFSGSGAPLDAVVLDHLASTAGQDLEALLAAAAAAAVATVVVIFLGAGQMVAPHQMGIMVRMGAQGRALPSALGQQLQLLPAHIT